MLASLALLGVLALGILPGLLITVALSILLLLDHVSRPPGDQLVQVPGTPAYVSAARHENAVHEPGLFIFRQDAPLIFVNATWMRDSLKELVSQEDAEPAVIVIDLGANFELDISCLDVLASVHRDFTHKGIAVWLANVRSPVRSMLERAASEDTIGQAGIFQTLDEVVQAFRSRPLAETGEDAAQPA